MGSNLANGDLGVVGVAALGELGVILGDLEKAG